MSFGWPLALIGLVAVPLFLGSYLRALRRRRRQAVTYSSIALVREALPRASRWQRHIPVVALAGSLGVLAFASARPALTTDVPSNQTTIILALDDSGSMCSTDVSPNRLAAAQAAAKQFVADQPNGTKMGLVVFSAFAELAVAPTTDRATLDNAIGNIATGPGTAIGAAMLQAIDAIAQVDPQVQPISATVNAAAQASSVFGNTGGTSATGPPLPKPGLHGYAPDVIVLLTDGANNRGITPLQAVPYAVERGIRVYTIGFGTTTPGPLICTPQQQGGINAGGGFGGGGFGGGFGGGGFAGAGNGGFINGNPLVADLPPLQQVSRETGALSFVARSGAQLEKVFAELPKKIAVQKVHHEVTADFVVLGALLALIALAASSRWSAYP